MVSVTAGYMDGVPGAVEVTMEAGDALIFVDCVVHGSTIRQIPGARRNILVSYGPDPENGWRAPPALFERCVHPSCVSAAAAAACA